ncbi:MAG: glycosyltransferase [Desulfobacterales bacterium]|nr:glycosyltransferase [Desulfobacterales bacterium]
MKLLIISNNLSRASFRLRVGDHLDFLDKEGIRCNVRQLPRKNLERWKLFKTSGQYDAVLIQRKCLNFWDAAVLSRFCPKMIFDYDDAIMHSATKPESRLTNHFRLFKRTARMMDVMIAGNEYLAGYARRYCKQVHILPTGLDTMAYQVQGVQKSRNEIRLVWIGSQATLKYLAELSPVLEQIGKTHKKVVLRIIADKFFDLENMSVQKHLWSLDNQISDLVACDIGLSPLPDNRFTRGKCGFKILQYFAAGLPVIASPVGVNEKFIKESNAGLLAMTHSEWQDAIEKMVNGIAVYRQLGQNGEKYVQAYDRTAISKDLSRIIKSAVLQS